MRLVRRLIAATVASLLGISAAGALTPIEPPSLASAVGAGQLAPVAERLPKTPLITAVNGAGWTPGQHGGELRVLMARPQDTRVLVMYSYARLVGYDARFELAPDILESLEVEQDRVFTMRLRRGHRWSDGHPFTAEDFRYYWQDVVLEKRLSPIGPPKLLLVGGKPPKVEFLDDVTIRFSWDKPNPDFLPALAGGSPLFIFRPAHYMKR